MKKIKDSEVNDMQKQNREMQNRKVLLQQFQQNSLVRMQKKNVVFLSHLITLRKQHSQRVSVSETHTGKLP